MTSLDTQVTADLPVAGTASAATLPDDPTPSPKAKDRKRLPSATVIALGVSVSVAVLAGWFAFYGLVLTGIAEHGTQYRLYGQLRSELAEETAPLGGSIKPGAPVALISVPALGLKNAVVVEGTTSQQLADGPGHLRDTPLPGQPGVSVIFGRSVTFGAPFADLSGLRPGALVRMTTAQGRFVYRVNQVRRRSLAKRLVLAPGESRISLVSSFGEGWRSSWAPNHTVVADATLLKGQVQAAPPGLPGSVSSASQPMQGETPPLFPLVLWLLGLLVAPVLAVWGWKRWGRWQVWLAGVPILVALLWGATRSADVLLPNLI